MHRSSQAFGLSLCLFIMACSDREPAEPAVTESVEMTNPFFAESTLPYGMPPFDLIENEHFVPAFERGMAEHTAEIEAIASNPEAATFDNTIIAMERSGAMLERTRRDHNWDNRLADLLAIENPARLAHVESAA